MIQVLIIEDEILSAEYLSALLNKTEPNIHILSTCDSVAKAINWLTSNPSPDLIFMDIHLADGISFEIFESIPLETPIIFTTAFNDYAIKAFKHNSIDYLLKPIKKEELRMAIEKFKKRSSFASSSTLQEVIKQLKTESKSYKERFMTKVGDQLVSIPISEVRYFKHKNGLVYLVTAQRSIPIDYTLEQLEQIIDPSLFFRINRQFIIQLNCISKITTYSTSRLLLELSPSCTDEVIVSRDLVPDFKKWLDR